LFEFCSTGNRQPNRGILLGDGSGSVVDSHEIVVERQNVPVNDRRDVLSVERHSHNIPMKDWQDFQSLPRHDIPFSASDHVGMDRADPHLADMHRSAQGDARSSMTLERRETAQMDRREFGFKGLLSFLNTFYV
jgi:hypothetical protein